MQEPARGGGPLPGLGDENTPACLRGNARLRREDSLEVERVRGGDADLRGAVIVAMGLRNAWTGTANAAHERDRFGESILLAGEALNEPTAAHVTP